MRSAARSGMSGERISSEGHAGPQPGDPGGLGVVGVGNESSNSEYRALMVSET